jgi:hypothetical protein
MRRVTDDGPIIRQRDMKDLLESTRYGMLYKIVGCHSNKFVATRCRVIKGKLVTVPSERLTVEKTECSKLHPELEDFIYVDRGPRPTWALWKVMG